MKGPFLEYLKKRISPCLFCFCSETITEEDKQNLVATWENINSESEIKVRLVFSSSIPTFPEIEEDMKNMRKLYPESTPYEFLSETKFPAQKETFPLAFLRRQIFEMDFMPRNFLPDIPIAIILLSKGNDEPVADISFFPGWARPYIRSKQLPVWALNIDDDIEHKLRLSQTTQIAPRLEEDPLPIVMSQGDELLTRKFNADRCMMQGNRRQAEIGYASLIKSESDREYSSHLYFLRAINSIVNGEMNEQTLELLETAKSISSDATNQMRYIVLMWWVHIKLHKPVTKLLKWVTESTNSSDIWKHVRPFFQEQNVILKKKRRQAYHMSLIGAVFHEVGCTEHAIECYWMSYCLIKKRGWDLIKEQIVNKMYKSVTGVDFSHQFSDLMCVRQLRDPVEIYKNMLNFSFKEVPNCGFVKARICSCESCGFASIPPNRFTGNWFMTCERLFGAFTRGKFFKQTLNSFKECLVGFPVQLTVRLFTEVSKIPFNHITLAISGNVETETTHVDIEHPRTETLALAVTPRTEGSFTVTGINFMWGDTITLFVPFLDNVMEFHSYANIPKVSVEESGFKDTMMVNETFSFSLDLKNSAIPLKHLSLFVVSDAPVVLVEPEIEPLCGKWLLDALDADEEMNLKLAIHGDKPGLFKVMIFISYWSDNTPLPRYEHIIRDIEVLPNISLKCTVTQTTYTLSCPQPYRVLGFTSNLFPAEKHTVIHTENTAQLNLISISSPNSPKVSLPRYLDQFTTRSAISFWCSDGKTGFVEFPLPSIEFHLAACFERITESQYLLTIRNLSARPLTDLKISMISPTENLAFILTGLDLKVIDKMDPNTDYSIRFTYISFDNEVHPRLLAACDQFTVIEDVIM